MIGSRDDSEQLELFSAIERAFADRGELDNAELYDYVKSRSPRGREMLAQRRAVGRAGKTRSIGARAVRWAQQTLKHRGLIERVPGRRGRWRITKEGKQRLTRLERPLSLVAFSSRLGVAVWGHCQDAAEGLQDKIHLILTSPPYPIQAGRAYGRIDESEYVDWLCDALAPFIERMADGGNLALNIGNDVFEPGRPSRSLYVERLVLALAERFSLSLMDRLVWANPCRPPGPAQWASRTHQQLNYGWEPIFWFTNNPQGCRSNNQRVLAPHSEAQQRLIAAGGERSARFNGDGAHRIRPGSFARPTAGRIPRNILSVPHNCSSQRAYKAAARDAGLPTHGAAMPLTLAEWIIRFLSREGDLVADPMAGSLTTAVSAEAEDRRWFCVEQFWEYLAGGMLRFDGTQVEWRHRLFRSTPNGW